MILADLPQQISSFAAFSEPDVVKLILWWAHAHDDQEAVDTDYLRHCYEQLHRALPREGLASILNKLSERRPPHVIRTKGRYKLEQRTLKMYADKYGNRDSTVVVEKLLRDLPNKLSNLQERAYLEEALICFRNKAFRAAIVMTWNLAYDHLCYWLLAEPSRLSKFNMQLALTYAKKGYDPIVNRDNFEDPKEFEVLQVCASAALINGGMHMILKEKLDRRNKAAHPTGTPVSQLTTESVIIDLIDGVVVKLA